MSDETAKLAYIRSADLRDHLVTEKVNKSGHCDGTIRDV